MPIISGIANWCYTKNPDVKYDPCWRISVTMSDEDAAKMKTLGIKVKRNDDGAYEYKFKRKVANKKGGNNPAPQVVDINKEPLDVIIGNGSKVAVLFKVYTWKNDFGKGIGADLDKIQVIELVPYGDAEEDFPSDTPENQPATPPVDEDF